MGGQAEACTDLSMLLECGHRSLRTNGIQESGQLGPPTAGLVDLWRSPTGPIPDVECVPQGLKLCESALSRCQTTLDRAKGASQSFWHREPLSMAGKMQRGSAAVFVL